MDREHHRLEALLSQGIDAIIDPAAHPVTGAMPRLQDDPELASLLETATVVARGLGSVSPRLEAKAIGRARFLAAVRRRPVPLPARS
ncbi:MAG: hypothetical protein HY689_00665 [Chloroflexi bacterium]|nr:hypothetical protein [Chloroflexota bacterium]